jgi:hypothetical protein
MSGRFEPFRPLRVTDLLGDLFEEDDEGISPSDAGIEDAKEAMAPARKILRDAAKDMKTTKVA